MIKFEEGSWSILFKLVPLPQTTRQINKKRQLELS